jgi:hypothetical protein
MTWGRQHINIDIGQYDSDSPYSFGLSDRSEAMPEIYGNAHKVGTLIRNLTSGTSRYTNLSLQGDSNSFPFGPGQRDTYPGMEATFSPLYSAYDSGSRTASLVVQHNGNNDFRMPFGMRFVSDNS